jgi:transcriptional regulator with XRE-family HTH domain
LWWCGVVVTTVRVARPGNQARFNLGPAVPPGVAASAILGGMVHAEAEIGLFLRARRAALEPADVGLPAGITRRRVRGLRREEAAQLAGISVDYYTRIEQGRGRNVSVEVLAAVSRALRLTGTEHDYLRNLAGRSPRGGERAGERTGGACEVPAAVPRQSVRPELRLLLEALGGAALVLGRGTDVLAWNRAGGRLWVALDELPAAELNLARLLFVHPGAEQVHPDLDAQRRGIVAKLRAETGRNPEEPRVCAVVQELHRESAAFREIWDAGEVLDLPFGVLRVRNPVVGELLLHFEKMLLPGDPDQVLMTLVAGPGSPSEAGLRRLAGVLDGVQAGLS